MKLKHYFVGLIIVVAFMLAIIYEPKSTIYITNEFAGETMNGPCMIIEYTINGVVQLPVTLYNYEGGRYEKFMAQLEKEGRVIR